MKSRKNESLYSPDRRMFETDLRARRASFMSSARSMIRNSCEDKMARLRTLFTDHPDSVRRDLFRTYGDGVFVRRADGARRVGLSDAWPFAVPVHQDGEWPDHAIARRDAPRTGSSRRMPPVPPPTRPCRGPQNNGLANLRTVAAAPDRDELAVGACDIDIRDPDRAPDPARGGMGPRHGARRRGADNRP